MKYLFAFILVIGTAITSFSLMKLNLQEDVPVSPKFKLGTMITWKLEPNAKGLVLQFKEKDGLQLYSVKYLTINQQEVTKDYWEHELLEYQPPQPQQQVVVPPEVVPETYEYKLGSTICWKLYPHCRGIVMGVVARKDTPFYTVKFVSPKTNIEELCNGYEFEFMPWQLVIDPLKPVEKPAETK